MTKTTKIYTAGDKVPVRGKAAAKIGALQDQHAALSNAINQVIAKYQKELSDIQEEHHTVICDALGISKEKFYFEAHVSPLKGDTVIVEVKGFREKAEVDKLKTRIGRDMDKFLQTASKAAKSAQKAKGK